MDALVSGMIILVLILLFVGGGLLLSRVDVEAGAKAARTLD